VKLPTLTIRARLTLLYTALFTAGGAVLITITFLLVAHSPRISSSDQIVRASPQLSAQCAQVLKDPNADANLRTKCEAAARQGFKIGAQSQRDTTLSNLLTYSITTLAAVTVLAAFAGWLLAGRVLRPLQDVTAAARDASENNLSQRLDLSGPRDELRQLADTFDDMLARLDAAFTSQRRFIANASHELRTPLTVMRTTIDVVLAKKAPTPAELTTMGNDVRRAVDHAEALLEALLTLARNDRGLTVREPVDLATVAEDVLDGRNFADLHVHASLASAPVTGDPVLLERLVANLVDNAVRYNIPGGVVQIATARLNGTASVAVTNTGPLVDEEPIDGLFQPFRRLHDRTSTDGLGLGLAIVKSIADIHSGQVAAAANPGGGLTIRVLLQSVQDPP
jgi:signal transduction histidine kinase